MINYTNIDVQMIANKRAKDVAKNTTVPLDVIRKLDKATIKHEYNLAVEYEDVPPKMFPAYLKGWRWRKG